MRKLTAKNTKVFDDGTVLDCIKKMLVEGYMPATIEEIKKAQKDGIIKDIWFDSRLLFSNVTKRLTMLPKS